MIPIIREPIDVPMPEICENCHFCRRPTRMWHENTNNPVCPDCAKMRRVSELPDYGKAIRAHKRRAKRSLPNAGGMARELAAQDSESPTRDNG